MSLRIGCGSWGDDAYVGVLYPPKTPKARRLAAYAARFDHVEVNSSYYATPRAATTAQWVEQTPAGFLFDIKLHRAFSQNPERAVREGKLLAYLREGVRPLVEGGRMGVFLLVLDPRFGPARHRLEELAPLAEALRPRPLAVELRDRAWVAGRAKAATLDAFRRLDLAWVATDMPRVADPAILSPIDAVTLPGLAYLRLHGRNPHYAQATSAAARHAYLYPPPEIARLATRIRKLEALAREVRVVANNHASDFAPLTALALRERLAR